MRKTAEFADTPAMDVRPGGRLHVDGSDAARQAQAPVERFELPTLCAMTSRRSSDVDEQGRLIPGVIESIAGLAIWAAAGGPPLLLLVTDDRGAWTLPQGELSPGVSCISACEQACWERAGIHGQALPDAIGIADATGSTALVHVLYVRELASVWPEDHRRQRRWFSLREALEVLTDQSIRVVVSRLAMQLIERNSAMPA